MTGWRVVRSWDYGRFKVVYFFDMQQMDDFEDKNNEP